MKLSTIFSKASLPGWFRNLLDHSPTWPESETLMILQLQAKVHGMGNLGVSTCTYPIFSWFETPKSDPSLPSSLTKTRATVGGRSRCEAAFSEPACLLIWLFTCLLCLACLIPVYLVCLLLIDWLTDWRTDKLWPTDRLTDWLIDWLLDWLIDWLSDWLTDSLTDWLSFFNLQGNPCLNWSWAWFY